MDSACVVLHIHNVSGVCLQAEMPGINGMKQMCGCGVSSILLDSRLV